MTRNRWPAGPALLVAFLAAPLQAQTGSVAGTIVARDGAPVYAALVTAVPEGGAGPGREAETDRLGRFRVDGLAPGVYEVRVVRPGYREARQRAWVAAGTVTVVDLVLVEDPLPLSELEVRVERRRARLRDAVGATVRDMDAGELGAVPGLGEADVLRAIETLPGVIAVSDYTAAFNVRGGSADQNLILLDGFPVYNPFHLGGLFSVFNPDMVARAELLAGGFPAEHGGRVSSVLNVESDAGPGGLAGGVGVSVLAGRVAVGADLPEGLTKGAGLGAGRWRIAGRRSYLDQVARPFMEFPYHFSDLQAFVETWTPAGGRITVTGYRGGDVLDLTRFRPGEFPYRLRWRWGNDVLGVRWTRPLAGRRAAEFRVGYSRFDNRMVLPDFAGTEFRSRIDHLLLRGDVDLAEWGPLALRGGVEAGRLGYDNLFAAGGAAYHGWTDTGWLGSGYAQARWMPAAYWTVELGTRGEAWFPGGGARVLVLSPRLAVKRSLAGGGAAARLAFGRYTQFAQSVRDEDLPIGIDVWVLAGGQAPYVVSHQAQAGLESFVGKTGFVAVEAFVRSFDGVIAFNYADDPNDAGDDFLTGTGLSYGADLLLRRESERGTSGSVAVSWLRAWRTFPDPISGLEPRPNVRYPPIFDRRLDVELVLRRSFRSKLEAGLRWHFGTGLPYTRPLGRYVYHLYEVVNDGRLAPWPMMAGEELHHVVALGARNAARYPAYHRLDVGVRRRFTPRWGQVTALLEVLNVYNRKNVLFYFYQYDRSPPTRSGISMFPFLPTLGVEVTF